MHILRKMVHNIGVLYSGVDKMRPFLRIFVHAAPPSSHFWRILPPPPALPLRRQPSRSAVAEPDAVLTGLDAVFAGPDAVFTGIDTVFTGPDAVFSEPDAVFVRPDAVFTGIDSVFTGMDAVFAGDYASILANCAAFVGVGTGCLAEWWRYTLLLYACGAGYYMPAVRGCVLVRIA